jgi:hypothetical protein
VDLPPVYGVVIGKDWSSLIGWYIMNDGSCVMLLNKDVTMIRVPWELRKPFSFKKNENELMQYYIDVGIGNYVVFDPDHTYISKQELKNSFEGFWRMYFDGACCILGSGVGIVFKSTNSIRYPHVIRLEFPCTNNEDEYEALIQGMNLALK